MEPTYFDRCYRANFRVRWICKFLKYSGFLDVDRLRSVINDKIARIEKRKGDLADATVFKITENLIWAKIAKKYSDKRIKPYTPTIAKDSPTPDFKKKLASHTYNYQDSAGMIFKEKHYRLKKNPSILIPGFLPDGNEAFFLLRKCFLKYGSVYYLNYPVQNFHKETIFHQLYDTIVEVNNRKIKNAGQSSSPFLIGTSFGGHIIVSFLFWLRDNDLMDKVNIKGISLISPVLSLDDLVDTSLTRQKTLIGRAVSLLCEVEGNDPVEIRSRIQKAKTILLKMFTSGRDLMNFEAKNLIPIFAIEDDVLGIFRNTAELDDGYFYRFLEMKDQEPIPVEFLTDIPTLVLFAEGENDVMLESSPTFQTFSDIQKLQTIFPNGTVEFVHSKNNTRKVTHSDLIFQADRFNEHLEPWLGRVVT